MDTDTKRIVLDLCIGSNNPKPTLALVDFCESSASLTIGNITVHIPWSELAKWQAWLAARVEKGS